VISDRGGGGGMTMGEMNGVMVSTGKLSKIGGVGRAWSLVREWGVRMVLGGRRLRK
jgi:hypothetical protein